MTEQPRTKIDYLEQLRKNWPVILFIGAFIMGYANIQNDIKASAKELDDLKVKNLAIELKVENYQNQVADISGDIKAIKESLSYIKDKVK